MFGNENQIEFFFNFTKWLEQLVSTWGQFTVIELITMIKLTNQKARDAVSKDIANLLKDWIHTTYQHATTT